MSEEYHRKARHPQNISFSAVATRAVLFSISLLLGLLMPLHVVCSSRLLLAEIALPPFQIFCFRNNKGILCMICREMV